MVSLVNRVAWCCLLLTALLLLLPLATKAWTQWLVLVHVVAALGLLYPILRFSVDHIAKVFVGRRPTLLITGGLSTGLLVALLASGVLMVIAKLTFYPINPVQWHQLSAVFFVGVFLAHWVSHALRSGLAISALKTMGLPLCIAVMLVFVPSLLSESKPKPVLIEAYDKPYGDNLFAPSLTSTAHSGFVHESDIGGSQQCATCHGDIAEQWAASMHRHAASDPTYVTNINLLADNKGIAATRYCEGCHAPIALLTGSLTSGGSHGGVAGTAANIEGVSCLSCHGVKKLNSELGVASYEFAATAKNLFESSNMAAPSSAVAIRLAPAFHKQQMQSEVLKTAEFCGTCHKQFMDESMNNWGWVNMQDELTAWVASPFSGRSASGHNQLQRVSCQDCHMPMIDANDPSANREGKVRSHRFLGANTFVPSLQNNTEQLDLTQQFLAANQVSISIEFPNKGTQSIQSDLAMQTAIRNIDEAPFFAYVGDQVDVRVIVSNIGVGHNFPGGTTDLNQAWIDLVVIDASGREVFRSGAIDQAGFVDPKAHFYRSIPVDRRGHEVWRHDLFNMTGETFKRVIPAGKSDSAEYQFSIPAWAQSPLSIKTALNYRKLNKRYSQWALKDLDFDLPVTEMAVDTRSFPIFTIAKAEQ